MLPLWCQTGSQRSSAWTARNFCHDFPSRKISCGWRKRQEWMPPDTQCHPSSLPCQTVTWTGPPSLPSPSLCIDTAGSNIDQIQLHNCLGPLWVIVICLKLLWRDEDLSSNSRTQLEKPDMVLACNSSAREMDIGGSLGSLASLPAKSVSPR